MESKILLTLPPDPGASFTMPDLGLGYLATALKKSQIPVTIVHSINEALSLEQLIRRIDEDKPAMVGIKFFSKDFQVAKVLVEKVKERFPHIITIGGGPHPSCSDPKELMDRFPGLDYAFRGEAEESLGPFIKILTGRSPGEEISDRELETIPGLIWRDGESVHFNGPSFVQDLDSLGFPAWDMIDPRKFLKKYEFSIFTRPPSANIIATRGCPFPCTFCATSLTTGRKVRKRSVQNLIEEIQYLQDSFGIKTINFIDDNFTFDREFVQGFCEEVLRRNMKFDWHCPYGVRLNSLDAETVRLMEKSGCVSVAVGIESGSPRILKHMRKHLTIDEIREHLSIIRKNSGLKVQGFFILGYPEETKEDIEATIKFARSLPLDMASFSLFCPIPGTAIYHQLIEEGKLSGPVDWENYTMDTVVYTPDGISGNELNRYHRRAYSQFYLRPAIIFNLLKQMKSAKQIKFLFWGLFHRLVLHRPQKNYYARKLIQQ